MRTTRTSGLAWRTAAPTAASGVPYGSSRLSRVAARGRGLGTELARLCIARAKGAGASEYLIDVVPSAVGFWAKLGFVEEEPDAEQEFFMAKGGDRPMSLKL